MRAKLVLEPTLTAEELRGFARTVAEMERRYRLMATTGVRNLSGFNRKVREAADAGKPLKDPFWQREQAAPGEIRNNFV